MNRKFRKLWFVAFAAAVCGVCVAQVAQQSFRNLPSVKRLMSHDEFTNAGLAKLNAEEIKALDAWLQKFAVALTNVNIPSTAGKKDADVIETYIDGDFEGWDGETIWKMDNGQIWQQSSYAYYYHYAYHPKVLIYRSAAGWKMKVDGVGREVGVEKIK